MNINATITIADQTSELVSLPTPTTGALCPKTLADLLPLIDSWDEWSPKRRSLTAAHIRTAATIAATARVRQKGGLDRVDRRQVVLASIPCDPAWLNRHLFNFPPKTFGLDRRSFGNVISALRGVLRRVDLLSDYRPPFPAPGTPWRVLLDELEKESEHCRLGLTGFATWCHRQAIEPAAVGPQTLAAFEGHVVTRTLHDDIPGLMCAVAKAWNKAATLLSSWPQGALRPRSRRAAYTTPLADFPLSFQEDMARFAAHLSPEGPRKPFRGRRLKRRLRPATVEARLFSLRQAASALVLGGRDPQSIVSLADLVEEDAFEAILTFYWERTIALRIAKGDLDSSGDPEAEDGMSSQTGAIATTLMIVAKYFCTVPADRLDRLRDMAADVTPGRQGVVTAKNLERLGQFDDPAVRRRLLDLPGRLMNQAEAMLAVARQEAIPQPSELRKAVLLEILLNIPMRIGNLVTLRLEEHLKYDGGRPARLISLSLRAHETKNRLNLLWSVSPELACFLERYIQQFLPILGSAGDKWLFPSPARSDQPLSADAVRYHIGRTVAEGVGAVVNPHLFRALAVRFILEDNQALLEDARLLLGDKSMAVILAHYAALAPKLAAERHSDRLRRARAGGDLVKTRGRRGDRGATR